MDTIAVFVDCNCFLQLRDLKDLPWTDLIPRVKRVEIMVTPSVLTELDQKKVDTKTRIRNRARAAIRLIDMASEADPMRIILRDQPIVVALQLPEIVPIDWSLHSSLDPTRADDQLVAQVIEASTDMSKLLLSHDAGPRITARRRGLACKNVPSEWLLPDQDDDDRKTIQRLQRENELLKANRPEIIATWSDHKLESRGAVVTKLIVPALSEKEISLLVSKCTSRWPQAVGALRVNAGFFIGVDDTSGQFAVNHYERYVLRWQKWRDNLADFLKNLPARIRFASRFAPVNFEYENVGVSTAERLTIAFAVSEGWRVFVDKNDIDKLVGVPFAIPNPPPTPFQEAQKIRGHEANDLALQLQRLLPQTDPFRDPTASLWLKRPTLESREGKYECPEFRAKRKENDVIWLQAQGSAPREGRITIDIHGSNLREPLMLQSPLILEEKTTTWFDPAICDMLDDELATMIHEAIAEDDALDA